MAVWDSPTHKKQNKFGLRIKAPVQIDKKTIKFVNTNNELTLKNKHQHTTRVIKHWGLSGYANDISRIKVYCTLIVKCLLNPQRFHTAIR